MNALTNPLTDSGDVDDPFANEVAANANADSGINLETHFPDGSPRPERLSEDTTYEEFLEWFEGSAMQGQMENYYSHRPETMNALSENSPGYERNEAGRYVNKNGEELYYYTGPDYENEKRNGAGLNANADYVTMDEIRKRYEEDTVLHKHFDSVDQYVSYITDRQDLIDSGQIMDKWERSNQLWHDTFMRTRDGRGGPNAQYIADILEGERRRVEEAELAANAGLAEQYGIETNITDDNGNTLRWNGSGYSLIERYKEDDKWGRKLTMAAASYIMTAGLAPALSGTLGAAGGKAAASAISNLATQYMQNGEVDWGSALMAAATAYGGQALSDSLAGSGVLGGIGDKITQFGDGIMAGGGDILSSAIQAGGMSLVTQLVMNGDIDWKDAAIAAAIAGGTTALQGFLSDIGKSGSETEVLEEIKVTAQRKGTQVGDGLWQLDDGTVISDTGNVLGNIANLDLDGDGLLNANDLQDIDVNHDYVDENYVAFQDAYAGEEHVYVDANGKPVDPARVKWSLEQDGYVDGNGNLVTRVNHYEVYGGDRGELEWQFGFNDDGTVSTTDGAIYYENGELAYEKVNGQWQDSDGNIIDDPAQADELTMIAAKAIDEPLNSVTYFDQDGNPITYKYPPAGLKDNYEQGQFSGLIFGPNGEAQEVWYDPVTNTEYIKAQGTTEIIAIRNPEAPQTENQTDVENNSDNSAETGNDNSSDAGQGQGGDPDNDTATQPGSGDSGAAGGLDGGGGGNVQTPPTIQQIEDVSNVTGLSIEDITDALANGSTLQDIIDSVNAGSSNNTSGGATSGGSGNDSVTSGSEDIGTDTSGNTGSGNGNVPGGATSAYEMRVQELIARGMSRAEAVANQNYAVAQGWDLNDDGAVTNAEYAQATSTGGGQTGGNADSGDAQTGGNTGGSSDGTGTGTGSGTGTGTGTGAGTGAGDGNGNGSGAGSGTGTGDGTGTGAEGSGSGSGSGAGTGEDTGAENGAGTGAGGGGGEGGGVGGGTGGGSGTTPGIGTGTAPGAGGGNGLGSGNGAGMLSAGGKGASTPYWSPIREQTMLPKYVQHRAALTASLWNDLMK